MLHEGDCLPWLRTLPSDSVDACVTDPPYGLSFMGKSWDHGLPDPAVWAEVLRVLKPGGHVAAFGGTRTFHRLACHIEDAGFDMRDTLMWLYGTGFPKSLDVSKAIDALRTTGGSAPKNIRQRDMGADYRPHELAGTPGYGKGRMSRGADTDRDYQSAPPITTGEAVAWAGWGTALKPAWEPIILARKPFAGTVAASVLAHGTGAINVDACRVPAQGRPLRQAGTRENDRAVYGGGWKAGNKAIGETDQGRWPANVLHDGSDEVEAAFAAFGGGGAGSVSRFFYGAKATTADRAGSKHPTVKSVALMRWLVRLVCPPNGLVLDPFAGSGTTLQAAQDEGFAWLAAEQDAEYCADIWRRLLPGMLS